MKRSDYRGAAAPNRGTMIRQSRTGTPAYLTMALERFPAPVFLTPTQVNIWNAALGDFPVEFFRARHLPIMIQYVRAVERMMHYSDQFEEDPEDTIAQSRWIKMIAVVARLENQLSLNTKTLIAMVLQARTEMKLANQQKAAHEAGQDEAAPRRGLVYDGY